MRDIKLVLEYDGTHFVGWQFQKNGRSVQEEISRVLQQVVQEPVTITGAGRTDSGVHARGQVASFQTSSSMSTGSLLAALNGLLPEDICILSVEDAPAGFNARFDARERAYRYYLGFRPSAIGRQYHWHVRYALDVEKMNHVAAMIVGEHDFASFCRFEAEVRHYRCTIAVSRWIPAPGQLTYEVRADRFLHGIVRALVGTMVDIGRGYTRAYEFGEILEAKDRRRAGMAAPPQGLFLEEVLY
jgi:tRNA pseudouridine38-40 synthase